MAPKPSVVLLSASPSPGMSHYARAMLQAMGDLAEVTLLDRGSGRSTLGVWLDLHRELRSRERYVLVSSPHWTVPLGLSIVGRTRGGFVLHDPILDAAGRWTRPLHRFYYRSVARRLRTVIIHDDLFMTHVERMRLKERSIVVVPHGFAPDELVTNAPYDPEGPQLFIGRLHAYKGVGVLERALERLRKMDRPIPVVVAGEGLASEAHLERFPNVRVIPRRVTDEEFRDLVASCSVVLLPYERANQSGVLATAFRSGRSVIASAVGSFPDTVVDEVNGSLFEPGDSEALADLMERMRSDPERARRLAEGARATWERDLAPERAAGTIVDRLVESG